MILILANRWDTAAHDLAARWKANDARVLTARDLSRAGWQQRVGQPDRASLVIDGEKVPQREIAGVLTRLPCIFAEELAHIVPEDRAYIAAEMNAFLHFWLAGLRCPVVNRPCAASLNGPPWRPEHWARAAADAGFAVDPLWPPPAEELTGNEILTVVADRCFGAADPQLQDCAIRLAARAGVFLLDVKLSNKRFAGVELLPGLSNPNIADSVLDAFYPDARGAA